MTALGPGVERLAEEAAALWPDARLAILSSDLAEGPGALKARIEEIARRRRRPGHRHPARLQGPQLPAPHARRRHRRRPRAAGRRPARRREDLPADPPGRRPRRPRRAPGPRAGPDPPARAPGDPRDPLRRRRGVLARRGRGPPPCADAALRPPRRRSSSPAPTRRRTWDVARALARNAEPLRGVGAELWGPAPAPIARIRGRHRVRLLVRAAEGRAAAAGAPRLGAAVPVPSAVRVPSTSIRRAFSDGSPLPALRRSGLGTIDADRRVSGSRRGRGIARTRRRPPLVRGRLASPALQRGPGSPEGVWPGACCA